MSNQQFMSSPERPSQQQERHDNDDPREQSVRQHEQERAAHESGYEEGYQGYNTSYQEGEKLRPAPPSQHWKIVLIILVIALIATGGGALGSLISVIFGILGSSFGLVVAACIVLAAVSTRPVPLPTRIFAVAEHAELFVHNDAGSVRILRGEGQQVEVRCTRYVSKLFGVNSASPLFFTQDGDQIHINVKHWSFMPFLHIGYVNLEIYVPANSDMQIQCNAGILDILGINGSVTASTNAGTVAVASSHLTDKSSLHTNAGTITISKSTLDGGLRGHTNAGTISIVESTLMGNTSFTTNAGTIRFDGKLAPNSDSVFKTNMGTVDIMLPPDSSFTLAAHSNMGSVHNDFQGASQNPHTRLTLDSQMGTINVRRRQG